MARVWPPPERQRAVWQSIVAVNEMPWEPMPGYVKKRCDMCELWYAHRIGTAGERCADCVLSHGLQDDTGVAFGSGRMVSSRTTSTNSRPD